MLTWRKSKQLVLFLNHLATLLNSGITLVDSFLILSKNVSLEFSRILITIQNDLKKGNSLNESLKKYPHYFDLNMCHLIEVGENTGKLIDVLLNLATTKEKIYLLKKKTAQALFYPIFILIVVSIITLLMFIFVIPQFMELYPQTTHLPLITKIVFNISYFLKNYFLFFLLSLITIIFLVSYLIKTKVNLTRHLYTIPLLKQILIKSFLVRFIRLLSISLSSGMPLMQALHLIMGEEEDFLLQEVAIRLKSFINMGHPLHVGMIGHSIFPSTMAQMVRIGEETGTLDIMLEKIANIYQLEVDQQLTYLSQILEPLIILILGVLIGTLLVALYMPIFKIGTIL